jgi:hypothetical protein
VRLKDWLAKNFRDPKKMDRNEQASLFFQFLSLLTCIAFIFISKFHLFGNFFIRVAEVTGLHGAQFLLGIGVLGAGFLAHWFKQQSQGWYGWLEVIFGLCYGFNVAFGIRPGEPMFGHWATLIGCVYIIARGLNNQSDAKRRLLASSDIRTSVASRT